MRRPKTKNEKTWNDADRKYVRAKRRSTNLPDSWDDKILSTIGNKSWKTKSKNRFQHSIKEN